MSRYPTEPNPWEPERSESSEAAGDLGHDIAPPEPTEYPAMAPPPVEHRFGQGYTATDEATLPSRPLGLLEQPPITIARTMLAWTLIIICTVGLYFVQQFGMEQMAQEAEQDPSPGVQALYTARYAVGMNEVFKGQAAQVMAEYDAAAWASSHQKIANIRGAILAGDLVSRDEALTRLNDLDNFIWEANDQLSVDQKQTLGIIERVYGDRNYVPDAGQTQLLIEHHGYFGELAAGYNLPENDARYAEPRDSAKVVFIFLMGLIGVVGLAFLAGIVLLIVLAILLFTGSQKLSMPRGKSCDRVVYLEVVALFLVGFIVLQLVFGLLTELTGIDWTLAFLLISPIVVLWPMLLGISWQQFKQDMGFHAGAGLIREIGSGIGGYVAGLPIIAIGFVLTIVLGFFSEATADHPMQQEIMNGELFSILLLIGAAVVWAPLVEEAVFRSAFYRHLRQHSGVPGWIYATVVTSFIFAAIHPQGWIGIPVLMSIAFVLAGLREWRGSIIPSMTAHALHNGTIMTGLLVVLYA